MIQSISLIDEKFNPLNKEGTWGHLPKTSTKNTPINNKTKIENQDTSLSELEIKIKKENQNQNTSLSGLGNTQNTVIELTKKVS